MRLCQGIHVNLPSNLPSFVVRTLIEKAKADRQPLYSCFVDLKKAYDTVPRDLLWEKLQRIGVHGAFLRGVQALYADVPMAVQFEGEGRKIYMYALTKPHGSCRGSGGSDMHKQIRNQNRDIKHPTA